MYESVSIIVGATDENEALKKTVNYIMENCNPNDIDKILIVNSKTASTECLNSIEALSEEYKGKVFGMTQSRPFIGGGILDGFDAATSSHLMLMPGDLGVCTDCVPRLIEQAKRNPDFIIKTSRWLQKSSFENYNHIRFYLNKTAQCFLKVLFLSNLTDFTLPVQIMPTKVYNSIEFKELNFPLLIELVVAPLRLGVTIKEIPVVCIGRKEGKSKNSVKQTFLYLKTALRVRFLPKKYLIKR